MSFLKAFLFSVLFLLLSAPLAMYLSNQLFTLAVIRRDIKRFLLQFLLFSVIIGIIYLAFMLVFHKFHWYSSRVYDFDIFKYPVYLFSSSLLLGVFINICFCSLRLYTDYVQLKKEYMKTELETLKGQINPNFLFNVLNHIDAYLDNEEGGASSLFAKYVDILKYQFYNGKDDKVSLGDEIQFLKNYIEIEKVRWEDKLIVECHWETYDETQRIPRLLLVPLVENAFKYVSKDYSGKGYIEVYFKQTKEYLYLKVKNTTNNQDKTFIKRGKNLNIDNLKQRLDIMYHTKYDLKIKELDTMNVSNLIINR